MAEVSGTENVEDNRGRRRRRGGGGGYRTWQY